MAQSSKKESNPSRKFELKGVKWMKINSTRDIEPGDHISFWESWLSPYWHHAIVESVNREANTISIILWSLILPKEIIRRDLRLSLGYGAWVQKAEYTSGCFSNEEVLHRARSRIGEKGYNVITNFARAFPEWCKTGRGRLTHNDYDNDCRFVSANADD